MQPTAKRISHLLATGNKAQLKNYVGMHHPVDVAAAITRLRPEEILFVIEAVGNHKGLEIFEELELDTQRACMEYADPERVIEFFEHLSPDEQADLIKLLNPDVKASVLSLLQRSEREHLMKLVKYEEGTAGSVMTTEFFALKPGLTALETLDLIRKKSEEAESIYTIYITNEENKLVGVLSLKDLVLAAPGKTLGKIMNPNVISATTDEDVEDVAKKIARYDLLAMPVVNANRELRGMITVDDVIDILEEETTEDIYALGAAGAPIDYLNTNVLGVARQRIPWLLVLVCSGFLAGLVLKVYRNELAVYVQLAFFMPLLMGSAGNAGTQASTTIVRGLATGELNTAMIRRLLFKEMAIGALIGSVMGLFAASYIMISAADMDIHTRARLALTVGATMVLVVSTAKSVGSSLPLLFKKLNLDPALMSGPLMASMVDIFTIFMYLTMARFILPGI